MDRARASRAGTVFGSRDLRCFRGNRSRADAARVRRNASASADSATEARSGVSSVSSAAGPRRWGTTRSSRLSTSCRILISVARRRRDALGTTWQKGTVREDLDFVRSGVERTIACRFKRAQPTPAPPSNRIPDYARPRPDTARRERRSDVGTRHHRVAIAGQTVALRLHGTEVTSLRPWRVM